MLMTLMEILSKPKGEEMSLLLLNEIISAGVEGCTADLNVVPMQRIVLPR
jgi:hypothetical protein